MIDCSPRAKVLLWTIGAYVAAERLRETSNGLRTRGVLGSEIESKKQLKIIRIISTHRLL